MSEVIDGVTAKFGTPEYYAQWLQMMLQTSIMSDSIGIEYKLPQCVIDFLNFINESKRKPRPLVHAASVRDGDDPLSLNIFENNLSARCFHCLTKVVGSRKLTTKAQFLDFVCDRDNLARTRNFGKKSLTEFYLFMDSAIARSYFYD